MSEEELTVAVSRYLKFSPELKSRFNQVLAYSYIIDAKNGIRNEWTLPSGQVTSYSTADLPPEKRRLFIHYVNYQLTH